MPMPMPAPMLPIAAPTATPMTMPIPRPVLMDFALTDDLLMAQPSPISETRARRRNRCCRLAARARGRPDISKTGTVAGDAGQLLPPDREGELEAVTKLHGRLTAGGGGVVDTRESRE